MPRPANPVFNAQPLRADESLRAIEFDGRAVQYILRRSRRRTIGLSIDQRGLRVGAPPRTPVGDIEALILRHRDWVAQKLDEWSTRRETERLAIEDGASLPLLGKTLQLALTDGRNRAIWNEFSAPPRLTLCLRAPEEAGRILETALRRKALELFAERLTHFAARMELTAPRLSLTSARTRWGSCSQRSGIRLNWRLIHFPLHVIDYVVVHELAHLREMNHSPRFWAVVEAICPNYRQIRRELKASAGLCPRW